MPQYNDLPKGATLVSTPEPAAPQYSDLPEGSTLIGSEPPAPSAPPDTRNSFQQYMDNATAPQTPQERASHGKLMNGLLDFGQAAAQTMAAPIAHPIKTAEGMAQTAAPDPGLKGLAEGALLGPAGPTAIHTAQGLYSDAKQNGIPHALGSAGGAFASGEVANMLPGASVGEGMKSTAGKLIDNTVGLTKKDVARGAQPGRAYLEGGGGPAMSMRGIANKASAINDKTGNQLGAAYQAADQRGTLIPAGKVLDEVAAPIQRLRNLQEGPGGTGMSPQIKEYEDRLLPPIAAAESRGGFKPSELFSDMKKPISQSTRWNDPTMLDLNKVRQQTTGRIGGLLTDAVPETAPLNKIYQGTGNLAQRAASRADTGQSSLAQIGKRALEGGVGASLGYFTHHPLLSVAPMVADSVPVRTTAATGLFQGGRILPTAATAGARLIPPAAVAGVRGPKPSPDDDANR